MPRSLKIENPGERSKKYLSSAKKSLFLFEFLALTMAFVYNREDQTASDLINYLLILLVTTLSISLVPKITKSDNILILIVTMLFSIGLSILYRLDPAMGERQLKFYLAGILVFFLTYFILNIKIAWENYFKLYFFVGLILFIATLVFGFASGGAKNRINIAGFTIQPSEFIKIPFAFMIASFYANYDSYLKKPFGKYYMTFAIYIFIGMFFLQRELGTALIFFGVMILSQFVYEKDKKLIIVNIGFMILGSLLAYVLFDHIKVRVQVWLDPRSDIDVKGYQITQSLFAIGSGGLFGTGLGLGDPEFIPVVESDFIFAAICEEMGVFMGIAVILLFLLLVYRAVKNSLKQQNKFFSTLAFVIGSLFALQSFLIIGGVMKLIPLTGVTLPFISAGGSSMISGFILLACLQYSGKELYQEEDDDD